MRARKFFRCWLTTSSASGAETSAGLPAPVLAGAGAVGEDFPGSAGGARSRMGSDNRCGFLSRATECDQNGAQTGLGRKGTQSSAAPGLPSTSFPAWSQSLP